MKRFLSAARLAAFFALTGCDGTADAQARVTVQQHRAALYAIQNTVYVKDARASPPVCVGYFWIGAANGGPAAFTVPCESVGHLLVNP